MLVARAPPQRACKLGLVESTLVALPFKLAYHNVTIANIAVTLEESEHFGRLLYCCYT